MSFAHGLQPEFRFPNGLFNITDSEKNVSKLQNKLNKYITDSMLKQNTMQCIEYLTGSRSRPIDHNMLLITIQTT